MLHIARSGLNWRNTVQVVLIGLSLHYLGTPGKLNVMLDVRRILGLHEHLLSAPWYRARFACRSFLSVDKLSGLSARRVEVSREFAVIAGTACKCCAYSCQ